MFAMVPASFTDCHQQALELDLWILSSTLSHGKSSHRRTIHFQRLQMAKNCFLRHRLNVLSIDWHAFANQLREFKNPLEVSKEKTEKRGPAIVGALDTKIGRNTTNVVVAQLQATLKDLQDRILSGSNDFYSRAFHASQAGMAEMGRGHFLPFLIVTYASIARLRSLLLRLQSKIKLIDIPSLLEMDSLWNVDDAIINQIRLDLVLLRDSIVLVSDPTLPIICSPVLNNEALRHEQLLASIGLTQATKKAKKSCALMYKQTHRIEANESSQSKKQTDDNDIGKKMIYAQPGIHAPSATGFVDQLDGNASFLTVLREKSKKKRKVTEAPKRKKMTKTKKGKKGDFFDELFG